MRLLKYVNFIKENYESDSQLIDKVISMDDVLKIHNDMITKYGGMKGIRDKNQLESCINKLYMSVFGEDIYPTIFHKAAAFLECMITTHPLSDGNKRTAFQGMMFILGKDGYKLNRSYDQSREFIVNVLTKNISIDGIVRWLKRNSKKI